MLGKKRANCQHFPSYVSFQEFWRDLQITVRTPSVTTLFGEKAQNSEIREIYTYVHPVRFPPLPMIMTETSSPSPFFESSFFFLGAAEWPKVSDGSDRCSSSQLVQITKLAQCPSDHSLARKSKAKGPKKEIAQPYYGTINKGTMIERMRSAQHLPINS